LSDRPQNENIRDLPQTTTLPLKDLWKNYAKCVFFVGTPFGFILCALAAWTTVYQDLLRAFLNVGLTNWWFFPLIVLLLGFIVVINHPRRNRKGGASQREIQKQ